MCSSTKKRFVVFTIPPVVPGFLAHYLQTNFSCNLSANDMDYVNQFLIIKYFREISYILYWIASVVATLGQNFGLYRLFPSYLVTYRLDAFKLILMVYNIERAFLSNPLMLLGMLKKIGANFH